MKKRYYLITAIAAYLVFLLSMLPAQPIATLINDNTPARLSGVSGSLWQGQARSLDVAGIKLTDARWNMKAWKLLLAQAALDIEARFEDQPVTGEVGATITGAVFVNTLDARLSADTVTRLANIPMAQLSGTFDITIDHASWRQGELPEAEGKLSWKQAAVTVAETASLGDVAITITGQDDSLHADVNNDGGDIELSGEATLNPQAEYQASMRFTPTASASRNLRKTLGMFAEKQADGSFLLNNNGSLQQLGLI